MHVAQKIHWISNSKPEFGPVPSFKIALNDLDLNFEPEGICDLQTNGELVKVMKRGYNNTPLTNHTYYLSSAATLIQILAGVIFHKTIMM